VAPLDREAKRFLEGVLDRVPLSARALGRVRRVARTLADLAGRVEVAAEDLAEAVQFRGLDLTSRAG
jgi:magnesium chelatase family protein